MTSSQPKIRFYRVKQKPGKELSGFLQASFPATPLLRGLSIQHKIRVFDDVPETPYREMEDHQVGKYWGAMLPDCLREEEKILFQAILRKLEKDKEKAARKARDARIKP